MPSRTAKTHRELTAQQLRFVAEYVVDYRARDAAIRAGYGANDAQDRASILLKNPKIAELVEQHRAKTREKLEQHMELTAERTLQTMAALAYYDPGAMVREDGSPKNISEMDRASRMAVQGFEVTETWIGRGKDKRKVVTTKVRLASRGQAIDMAAKVAGAYAKDNEQRRNAREMTDDELLARAMTLMGLRKPEDAPVQ